MKVLSDVAQILVLIAMTLRGSSAGFFGALLNGTASAIDTVATGATQGVATVGHGATSVLSTVLSSECTFLKQVLGLNYDQVQDTTWEPDLEKLTVEYISPNNSYTFNLTSLAAELDASGLLSQDYSLHLYMHGFTASPDGEGFQGINKAVQTSRATNTCILALDASDLIGFLYLRSSTYVRFIGEAVAAAIADLVILGYVHPDKVHLIGHSLGAHIAGFAAKTYTALTGEKLGHVTGLDPAGPCFKVDDDLKLCKTDAVFVDVIHTNAGALGTTELLGQADYFVNGGGIQRKCLFETCSHSRVLSYVAESIINPSGFPAIQCDSYADFKKGTCNGTTSYMGMGVTRGTQGKFYVQTNEDSPWARGEKGLYYS